MSFFDAFSVAPIAFVNRSDSSSMYGDIAGYRKSSCNAKISTLGRRRDGWTACPFNSNHSQIGHASPADADYVRHSVDS